MTSRLLLSMLLAAGLISASALHGAPVRTDHTQVELIAETSSVAAGKPFSIGLRLMPDIGWHTYWINPGDAGKAAKVNWDLPEGFLAAPLAFPAPGFVPFGPLMSYGYNEATLLISEVSVPDSIEGGKVRIAGRADWLVCDDKVCIPERAEVELVLPKGSGEQNLVTRAEFAAARALQPLPANWRATYSINEERVRFSIDLPQSLGNVSELHLFPVAEKLIDHVAEQRFETEANRLTVEVPAGPRAHRYEDVQGVLTLASMDAPRQALALSFERVDPAQLAADATGQGFALLQALVFAFLGGLILNLMPCVLPILSLKALSLVEISARSSRQARYSGIAYTVGVLVSFLLLALLMIGLRSAGEQIGWAFHLQNPTIVALLALVMFVVGMNFLGAFELSGRLPLIGGLADKLGQSQSSEFFTGALAVVVASPCTVPFMSPALGFALTQNPAVSLLVFAALGMGFAVPFLAVALFPAARAWLPKPGGWMQGLRQVLAFPMFATALWLLWVLGRQTSVDVLSLVLSALIGLGFALFAWGRIQTRASRLGWSLGALAGGVIAAGGLYLASALTTSSTAPGGDSLEAAYSEERLAQLHAQGTPVFAYFTADWCITCKVNERVALNAEPVREFFNAEGIEVLVGDWTNEDAHITTVLERHGRSGVPLYLYFKPGDDMQAPLILPSLLTPDLVIDSVSDA
ncbi:MAG: thioredoxin family protein [Gammaproteobacteria bacterium]|nr:thioredoxin family protein [Gammaproteobacteria bacterium]